MTCYDIIPDIHGQSAKLRDALTRLGWRRGPAGWHNTDPRKQIVFLGDFIDRGPDNRGVLDIVRSLIDAGKARAVMGNHELNALHFHTSHPDTGTPLRPHSEKNIRQHKSFLEEFPPGDPNTRDALGWMLTLPLFLEEGGFRAVHACWDESTITRLRALTGNGVLSEEQLIRAAHGDEADEMFDLVERTAKGPEHRLPEGYVITDKDGTERKEVRLEWWNATARTWRDIAISVPHVNELPVEPLPRSVKARTYPAQARPVFFGHYWLTGTPRLQAPNALCLDYSAGRDGPLVSYSHAAGASRLSTEHITVHELAK